MPTKLPPQRKIEPIDLFDCDDIKTVSKVPEELKRYKQFYQGLSCNAKIGSVDIKKEKGEEVQEARVFCDAMFIPSKQLTSSKKEAFIKQFGAFKGKFYYENEFLMYKGKDDKEKISPCQVAMQVKLQDGNIVRTIYNSNEIYLRKPKKEE